MRLIQISDTHIDTERVMGVDNRAKLMKFVRLLQTQDINIPLIISGDLVHKPNEENYQFLVSQLKLLAPRKIAIIGGNHDNSEQVNTYLSSYLMPYFNLASWQVVFIDSVVNNQIYGNLNHNELKKLSTHLCSSKAKHIMLVLHHPIINMQSSWDDNKSLQNPADLFNLITKFKAIKAITWGHAHQYKIANYKGLKLFSCPGLSKQFVGDNTSVSAYLEFDLLANGDIEHTLIRVK